MIAAWKQLIRVRGHTLLPASLSPDSTVVDAGAHAGEFSQEIHQRFDCQCHLIEANPVLASQLVAPPKGTVIHAALCAETAKTSFIFRDNPEGGGVVPGNQEHPGHTTEVDAINLSALFDRLEVERIDLLKLDIEGAEFDLITSTPHALWQRIHQVTIEFHDFQPSFHGRGLYQKARRHLLDAGFRGFNMAFRTHGDVLFLNRKTGNLGFGSSLLLSTLGKLRLKAQTLRAKP